MALMFAKLIFVILPQDLGLVSSARTQGSEISLVAERAMSSSSALKKGGDDLLLDDNAKETLLKSTPDKIYSKFVSDLPNFKGGCAAITGTTSGIGRWAATAMLQKVADTTRNNSCILLLNRNSVRAEKAAAEFKRLSSGTYVEQIACDLQNLESVRTAATAVENIANMFGGVSVLALNAGVTNLPDKRTADGLEVQMQTNFLSHFLLTKLLLNSLKSAADKYGDARIVAQSSIARHGGDLQEEYFVKSEQGTLGGDEKRAERYHQTKLASAAFAMSLARKLAKSSKFANIKAFASAPGFAQSNIISKVSWWKKRTAPFIAQSAADGSCPLLACMLSDNANSGDFYEPRNVCGLSGLPFKVIEKGKAKRRLICKSIGDQLACNESTQDLMWSASEKGLGEVFSIE